jgi:hypothetical protein
MFNGNIFVIEWNVYTKKNVLYNKVKKRKRKELIINQKKKETHTKVDTRFKKISIT